MIQIPTAAGLISIAWRLVPWIVLTVLLAYGLWRFDSARQDAMLAGQRVDQLERDISAAKAQRTALDQQLADERKAADEVSENAARLARQLAAARAERETVHADPSVRDWAAQRLPDLVYARRLQRYAAKVRADDSDRADAAGGVSAAVPVAPEAGPGER